MKILLAFLVTFCVFNINYALIIECDYKVHSTYGYGCEASFMEFSSGKLKLITGVHEPEMSLQNVKYFMASSDKLTEIPSGLGRRFKNLEVLNLNFQNLESICQQDLRQFKKLKSLMIQNSKIESIAANLFKSTPDITYIQMSSNRIKSIHADAFKPLTNLKTFFADFNCFQDDAMNSHQAQELIEKLAISCYNPSFKVPSPCKKDYDKTQPVDTQYDISGFDIGFDEEPLEKTTVASHKPSSDHVYWTVGSVVIVLVIIATFIVIKAFKK
jgi:hypothetical protein